MVYLDKRLVILDAGRATQKRMMELAGQNFKGDRLWSSQEDNILLRFPDLHVAAGKLPHRTKNALIHRFKSLRTRGMIPPAKPKKHRWTESERKLLRKLWKQPTPWLVLEESFPFATRAAMYKQASRFDFRRGRQPLAATGDDIFDQFRRYCQKIRISLEGLSEDLGFAPKIFHTPFYKCKGINRKRLIEAITFLEGTVENDKTITWSE